MAAAWQSSIGSVAAGSAFATLQSAGATGAIASVFGAGATAATGAVVADRHLRNEDHQNNGGGHDDNGGGHDDKRGGNDNRGRDNDPKNQNRNGGGKAGANEPSVCPHCGARWWRPQ
ncbi:expressed unknown protein [Seminavis robusta]|nr:expressed unknown protein [Seminavis robusta]|eukprot:Sro720_g192460.1 n/a (117) ;mRNA; f:1839-2189